MTVTLHIRRVTSWGSRSGGTLRGRIFIIESMEYLPGQFRPYVFRTFDPWAASVCDRASATGQAVILTYHEATKYGHQLDGVELEPVRSTA